MTRVPFQKRLFCERSRLYYVVMAGRGQPSAASIRSDAFLHVLPKEVGSFVRYIKKIIFSQNEQCLSDTIARCRSHRNTVFLIRIHAAAFK
jgi:hypothetical protein